MKKAVVDPNKLEKFRSDPLILKAIQIMRIISNIRYNNINQIRIMDLEGYDLPTHFNLIINHAACLFEGIRAFQLMYRDLHMLDSFKEKIETIKEINKEIADQASFYNKVLKVLRNTVVFHFDEDFIHRALDKCIEECVESGEEVVVLSGSSNSLFDTRYNIADSVIITYCLAQVEGERFTERDRVRVFSEKLLDLAGKLLDVLDHIIPGLFLEYVVTIEE